MTNQPDLLDRWNDANGIEPDIAFLEPTEHGVEVAYRGMALGWVTGDADFGLVFAPFVDFGDLADLSGCAGTDWQDLVGEIDSEVSCYRDILDARVEGNHDYHDY